MSRAAKPGKSRGLWRLVGTLAVIGVWSVGLAGTASPVFAADVQSRQWYLSAMEAEQMWKVSTGVGIKVAVIDTGVNPSTPSLKGQVLKGIDATEAEGDETDDYSGHGTTMAELIAGTGKGGGLRGLAPGAKIMPLRVSDTQFQDKHPVNAYDTADAIRAAADSDARIISMSFSSDFSMDREEEAVKYAQRKGKLFFSAVGNDAEEGNKEQYPAAYPEVVGVASADRSGKVAKYSQYGNNVDIAAPGNDIPYWCDEKFQSYCYGDGGTSAATAIASASAALVWSAHPDWTANQVLSVLFDTASRDWDMGTTSKYLGHGLIRPSMNIIRGKGTPGAPDVSPLTNEKTTAGSTAAPTASATVSPQPSKEEATHAVAADSNENSDSGGQRGLLIGVVVVAVVLGGGALLLLNHRRRKTA